MTEDEDRLRELLRAPLDDAAPVRFEPVHAPIRMHRAATMTVVVVVVAFITGAVVLFRAMADRSQPVAGRSAAGAATQPAGTDPVLALTRAVPCGGHRRVADAEQLRGFQPVAALRCDVVRQGSATMRTREVSAGPFGALVRDLERPADVAPAGGACAMHTDQQPRVFLVDATGHYILLGFPRDGCGLVHGTPAYVALRHLTWYRVH